MSEAQSWHLDRRIPIALILTAVGQVAFLGWAAGVVFKDIENNRVSIGVVNGRVEMLERNASAQAVQLGRIDENVRGMRSDINRLLNLMERRME